MDGIQLQPSESLLRFQNPDFWIKEARGLQTLLQKQAARHPQLKIPTAPSPETLQQLFDTWLSKRPDLPRLVAPATSGSYDETYFETRSTVHKEKAIRPANIFATFRLPWSGITQRCNANHNVQPAKTKGVFIHTWKWLNICEYLKIMVSIEFWCAKNDLIRLLDRSIKRLSHQIDVSPIF